MSHPALRPRWLIGHVIVVALVVTCVLLGFWQLRRLHEREASNAVVQARLAEPIAPFASLVPAAGPAPSASGLHDRRVVMTGTYEADREVLIRGRSDDRSNSGFWSVMPVRLADGRAVTVVRGWIPFAVGDGPERPVLAAAPPTGPVTVTGIIQPTQTRGLFGATDPADGTLREMARVDVARLGRQVPGLVGNVWVQLTAQDPANAGELPKPLSKPELSDGPHLSYAIQWFGFAVVFGVGWVLLVRRNVRKTAARPIDGSAADAPGSVEDSRSPADVNSGA